MKKIISLSCIITIIVSINSYGQQQIQKVVLTPEQKAQRQQYFEHKADSVFAAREVQRMKEIISITPQQLQALFQAGKTISNNRRSIFKAYWKTDAFKTEMAKVDSAANVLYQSIIGVANYRIYKDTLYNRLIQRQQNRQQPTDSLNRDKNQQL